VAGRPGGLALEFPTTSLALVHTRAHSMKFRNLMAVDTEEMILRPPMDSVVLMALLQDVRPAMVGGSAGKPSIPADRRPQMPRATRTTAWEPCNRFRHSWTHFPRRQASIVQASTRV